MTEKKGKKSNWFWVYAVLLFTSAFVILVVTAYSQIKYNKEKGSYQSTLENEIAQKDTYKINLSEALAENQAILDELETLKSEKQAVFEENAILKAENQKLRGDNARISKCYERYIAAEAFYAGGDWTNAATMLFEEFDVSVLTGEPAARAASIMATIGDATALRSYQDGYQAYIAGRYAEAAALFKLAYAIHDDTYYSDDCLYLEAHCYMAMQDDATAAGLLKTLIDKFPNSELTATARTEYERIRPAVVDEG
jgi:TolA-binding protein